MDTERLAGRVAVVTGGALGGQELYELNLLHVLRMCHALLPAMIEKGRGAIVNNATVEAFRGIPYAAVYAAFNAGVVAFTR